MPPVDVVADDEGDGIKIGGITGQPKKTGELDAGYETRAIPVAPVEDHAFMEVDWLAAAVRLDVGDERLELSALHQREDVRERMKLERLICAGGCFILVSVLLAQNFCRAPRPTRGVWFCVGHGASPLRLGLLRLRLRQRDLARSAWAAALPHALRETTRDKTVDRGHNYFACATIAEGFNFASRQQLVPVRIATSEHSPGSFWLDEKRAFPIGKIGSMDGHCSVAPFQRGCGQMSTNSQIRKGQIVRKFYGFCPLTATARRSRFSTFFT